MYRTNGETTRYIKDAHGNVVATTRNNSIAGEYDYTAFGVQQNSTDTSNPFRYCGEYYDNESGLVYLRNRYYQAETGRFITEDPIKDGLNWYSYCAGNPVMFVDKFGLKAFDLIESSLEGLSDIQKKNIASAQHARDGGYITPKQFAENVVLNGGEVERLGITVSEQGTDITITAYATYTVKDDYRYKQLNKEYQFSKEEIKKAVKNGIEKGWTGQYQGKNIKTKIILLDSNSIETKIYDTVDITQHEAVGHSNGSLLSAQTMNVYLGTTKGEIYSLDKIGYVSAHEFGHAAFKIFDIGKQEGYNTRSMIALMCSPKRAGGAKTVDFELMATSPLFANTSIYNTASPLDIIAKYKEN